MSRKSVKKGFSSGAVAYGTTKSVEFNASVGGQYINFGNVLDVDGSEARTYSGYLKINTTGGTQQLHYKTNGSNAGQQVYIHTTGIIQFYLRNITGGRIHIYSTPIIPTTGWPHWAITYTGSKLAAGVLFYFNGLLVASTTVRNDFGTGTSSNSGELWVGQKYNLNANLKANIYSQPIFNRVLTALEILELSTLDNAINHSTAAGSLIFNPRFGNHADDNTDSGSGDEVIKDLASGYDGLPISMVPGNIVTTSPFP